MTRDEWIKACADRFAEHLAPHASLLLAVAEFNIRCREEPLDYSPELPQDRWPEPRQAALDALHEMNGMAD